MNMIAQMHQHGYVVIPQAIGSDEIQTIRDCYKHLSESSGLSTLLPTDILNQPAIFNVLLKENITSAIR
ncbi:hypothetical protein [Klebsiella quasipneumoniae]